MRSEEEDVKMKPCLPFFDLMPVRETGVCVHYICVQFPPSVWKMNGKHVFPFLFFHFLC